MLGPIIMLNKISRLLLTANIVKAKLHILTTHTHMCTTKPTSRNDSLSRGHREKAPGLKYGVGRKVEQ